MELWGDNIRISVKDSGKGIPADQLDIIFERFRQVDKSLAREHEGSGIGLSLVKSLVELHGGTVNAKSTLNDGSEFIIDIPIVKIKEIQQSPTIITNEDNRIERINIEFSDIYEIS
jgi:signal transduction histidine kinase